MLRAIALCAVVGCSSQPIQHVDVPEPYVLEGDVCAPPVEGPRPVKVLIALVPSGHGYTADPDSEGARAVGKLIESLPKDASVGVMLTWEINEFILDFGRPFVPVSSISPFRLESMMRRLTWGAPATTDFAANYALAVNGIAETIARDLAAEGAVKPQYSVLFVSDGSPRLADDFEVLCGGALSHLQTLGAFAGDVKVHTAQIYLPLADPAECASTPLQLPESACAITAPSSGLCTAHRLELDAERLKRIARLGGGEFRSFRDGAPIDFGFATAWKREDSALDSVLGANLERLPSGALDSDHDGLSDEEEERFGLSPKNRDSDGDGFSDGVERWATLQGRAFDASRKQLGCSMLDLGKDTDCDGLGDCDETVLETNPSQADTDDDGLPDLVEFLGGTKPIVSDAHLDPDGDGVTNGEELRRHTDPRVQEASPGSAYTYSIEALPRVAGETPCFHVKVEGIAPPPGDSTAWLSVSLKPQQGKPVLRHFTAKVTPDTKQTAFTDADLKTGCGP